MKRPSQEAVDLDENHSHDEHQSDNEQSQEAGGVGPDGHKRVNMPKKSKHRTRAHVNPMGDLNIPTYKIERINNI